MIADENEEIDELVIALRTAVETFKMKHSGLSMTALLIGTGLMLGGAMSTATKEERQVAQMLSTVGKAALNAAKWQWAQTDKELN